MNIFLLALWNDSTKTIRLLALDFYAVIVSLRAGRNATTENCQGRPYYLHYLLPTACSQAR